MLHFCQLIQVRTHIHSHETHTQPLLGLLEIFIIGVLHGIQHAMTNLCKTARRPDIPSLHAASFFLSFSLTHTQTQQSLPVSPLSSIFNSFMTSASLLPIEYFPQTCLLMCVCVNMIKSEKMQKIADGFPVLISDVMTTFQRQAKNISCQLSSPLPLQLTNANHKYMINVTLHTVRDKSFWVRIRITIHCTVNTWEFIFVSWAQGHQKDLKWLRQTKSSE